MVGCGAVGGASARLLAGGPEFDRTPDFDRIIVADRDGARAASVAEECGGRVSALELDLTDDRALTEALSGVSVFLNAAGPFNPGVLALIRTVMDAGVSYADVNDDIDSLQAVFESEHLAGLARDRSVSVIAGLGACPGETNAVARFLADRMDRVDEVEFYMVEDSVCRSVPAWRRRLDTFGSPALVWRDGAWDQVPGMSESEEVMFPEPWGLVRCYTVDLAPVTLPLTIRSLRQASLKKGFLQPNIGRVMEDFVAYGLAGDQPLEVSGAQVIPADFGASLLSSPPMDRLFRSVTLFERLPKQVRVSGIEGGRPSSLTMTYSFPAAEADLATASSLVVGARVLLSRELASPGVYSPEALDPAPFIWNMERRGVGLKLKKTDGPWDSSRL